MQPKAWIIAALLLTLLAQPLALAKKDDERDFAKAVEKETLFNHLNAYTFAKGTTFITTLETPLSTEFNQPEDTFRMRLIYDVWVDQQVVIKQGATFIGHVEALRKPMQGKNAEMKIVAHGVETLDGEVLPLDATIYMAKEGAGVLGGEVTQPVNARLIRYHVWGIGLYNRVMPAGPRMMGEHKTLKPGQLMRVTLNTPLKVVTKKDALTNSWLKD